MGSTCGICASAINDATHEQLNDSLQCGECVTNPPLYTKLVAATRYQFPVDKALSDLKFNKQLHYARSLTSVLERRIRLSYEETPYPKALIPIPLHPKRLNERGFNQSDIIAKHLSNAMGIPPNKALSRVKDTPHQVGLSEKQRRQNLKDAFQLEEGLPKHIALVDDVVTTGSTVNEAAKLCLSAGVERVDIWCLAKT
ncbi:ComF family protein [Kangiella marina]|uniref:ComF family protein n=2 Tax=Kangiella marina TaxID=1079178 RepID=A0ABP8IFY6_9GAMM